MKWARIKPYVLTTAVVITILTQSLMILDYHFRLKMSHENTDAWFDTATQWQLASENWEVNTRKLAAINYACTTKLHSYQEFVTQLFDPRLQKEIPLKPLDLIEAPQK